MAIERTKRLAIHYTRTRVSGIVRVKYNTFNEALIENVFKKDNPQQEGSKISALPRANSLFDRKNLTPYLIEVLDAETFNPLFEDWYMIGMDAISYIPLKNLDNTETAENFPKHASRLLALTSVLVIIDETSEPTGNSATSSGPSGVIIFPFSYLGFDFNIKTIQYSKLGKVVTINNGEGEVFREEKLFEDRGKAKEEGQDNGASKGAYVVKGLRAVFSDLKPGTSYAEGQAPSEIKIRSITALGLAEPRGQA